MSTTLKIANGDIVKYSGSKYGFETISGRDKVTQDLKMIFTTSIRASTGIGCGLEEVIGNDTMDFSSSYTIMPAVFDFQNRCRVGLSTLQNEQKRVGLASRTPDELIRDFSSVKIIPDSEDSRSFKWSVDVATVTGFDKITISGKVG
jgi:hypothetical protein